MKFIGKNKLDDKEFINNCDKLRELTWHRGEKQREYEERIKNNCPLKLEKDCFKKEESNKRYNPTKLDESYTKNELENLNGEEWRFLSNTYYTKYAVSANGRVAFFSAGKYHILFQDDKNNDGYLRLDPEGNYNLDHKIEVYKLIAMGFLGKKSGDGYDVHHIINDGYNCRPGNLILLTRAQHNLVHMSDEQFEIHKNNIANYLKEK